MADKHVTGNDDVLDLICTRHYGREAGAVEAVLEANPDIAAFAHRLPMGVEITLPDLVARENGAVRLWD